MAMPPELLDQVLKLPEADLRALRQLIDERLDLGDELDDDDRERLHAALDRALASHKAGLGEPADVVMARLRGR
jgi:hypothetical protein